MIFDPFASKQGHRVSTRLLKLRKSHPCTNVSIVLISSFIFLHMSGEMAVDKTDICGVKSKPATDTSFVPQLTHDACSYSVHTNVIHVVLMLFLAVDQEQHSHQSYVFDKYIL